MLTGGYIPPCLFLILPFFVWSGGHSLLQNRSESGKAFNSLASTEGEDLGKEWCSVVKLGRRDQFCVHKLQWTGPTHSAFNATMPLKNSVQQASSLISPRNLFFWMWLPSWLNSSYTTIFLFLFWTHCCSPVLMFTTQGSDPIICLFVIPNETHLVDTGGDLLCHRKKGEIKNIKIYLTWRGKEGWWRQTAGKSVICHQSNLVNNTLSQQKEPIVQPQIKNRIAWQQS